MDSLIELSLDEALADLRAGRYDAGLAALDEIVGCADHPSRARALAHRAFCRRCRSRFADSASDYRELCVLEPDDPEYPGYLSEVLLMLGQEEEARLAAVDALRLDPTHRLAGNVIAACVVREGGEDSTARGLWRINSALVPLYNGPGTFPTSIAPQIAHWMYELVRLVRPVRVLETGTFIGFSSIVIASALRSLGDDPETDEARRLDCFDVFSELHEYTSPMAVEKTSDCQAVAQAHIDAAGVGDLVTLHKGPSAQTIAERIEPDSIDLAFIDADHLIDGAEADWRAVDRVLKVGGYVLLHDTDPERSAWMGPRAILAGLQETGRYEYPAMHLPTPDGSGIGLIQKQSTEPIPTWSVPMMARVMQRLLLQLMRRNPRVWR